ncbi:MAG TPA: nitroreductase family protein [Terriglobales bacterium]|nr:nitroreductase family protein [Terriglobales bacterium]
MRFTKPITDIIRARTSVRTYAGTPIDPADEALLRDFLSSGPAGPFGTKSRFELITAGSGDADALKGLGTYGAISRPAGFIAGAVENGGRDLEDFGYIMETVILLATDLGLGTCWLGGSFRQSRFAAAVRVGDRESIPAVVSLGNPAAKRRLVENLMRRSAKADTRMPWEPLFFLGAFDRPLSRHEAGEYAEPLEMVRLGPSASNKQPWRVVKDPEGAVLHFYLQRTKGYDRSRRRLFRMADLQRVDIGIAMCHFALTAEELGLAGAWATADPRLVPLPPDTEYVVSWRA